MAHIPYQKGDQISVQCVTPDVNGTVYVDQNGELIYGPGPTCEETNLAWSFRYGEDQQMVCRWRIDEALYSFLRMILQGQAVYRCRIPLSKDGTLFMPYPIALWGGVEPSHIHLMNHMNFVFHASEGFLLGAAAYPLRDHYQLIESDGTLTVHGPVRWYQGHQFVDSLVTEDVPEKEKEPEIPLSPAQTKQALSERACVKGYGMYHPYLVWSYCLLSSITSVGLTYLAYRAYIQPEWMGLLRKKK
jgi:hypothetical protein